MGLSMLDLKALLRLLSAATGLSLLGLACAGFDHLGRSGGTLDGQASFGCMCVLGVSFGALVFLGESHWERFFFLFGFMRYRLGRAAVLAVAGTMSCILGKNMNDACRCQRFFLPLLIGAACLGCAALHLFGIVAWENNTTKVTMGRAAAHSQATGAAATHGSSSARSATETSTYVPPTPAAKAPAAKSGSSNNNNNAADPNLPAWMNA